MESMHRRSSRWTVASSSAASAALAIAATLLVTVWARPEAETISREGTIEVAEVQSADREPPRHATSPQQFAASRGGAEGPASDGPTVEEPTSNEGTAPRAVAADPPGFRAAQLERLALLLRPDARPSDPMTPDATGSDPSSVTTPNELPTYYQQRQQLLGDQANLGFQSAHPHASVRGA